MERARPGLGRALGAGLGLAGVAAAAAAVLVGRAWLEVHFAKDYCAIGARDEHRMTAVRVVLGLLGASLLLFAAPLGRRMALWTRATFVTVAVRGVLPAVLALVVCDVALRLTGHGAPALPPPNPLYRGDPELGGVYVPDNTVVETVVASGWKTTYAIDHFGYRDVRQDALPDTAAPTLLFAGESIAVGTTVPYEESYGAVVGRRLGMQSVNVSVAGFANDQAYLFASHALDRFPRTAAVVMLIVPVQVDRNVRAYTRHLALDSGGALRWVDPAPEWWRTSPLRAVFDAAVGYHGDEALRIARASFLALDRAAVAHGASTLFVLTNYGAPCDDAPGTSSIEREVFGGTGLRSLRVDVDPALHVEGETHPDARGHLILADAIERALREMGVHAP